MGFEPRVLAIRIAAPSEDDTEPRAASRYQRGVRALAAVIRMTENAAMVFGNQAPLAGRRKPPALTQQATGALSSFPRVQATVATAVCCTSVAIGAVDRNAEIVLRPLPAIRHPLERAVGSGPLRECGGPERNTERDKHKVESDRLMANAVHAALRASVRTSFSPEAALRQASRVSVAGGVRSASSPTCE